MPFVLTLFELGHKIGVFFFYLLCAFLFARVIARVNIKSQRKYTYKRSLCKHVWYFLMRICVCVKWGACHSVDLLTTSFANSSIFIRSFLRCYDVFAQTLWPSLRICDQFDFRSIGNCITFHKHRFRKALAIYLQFSQSASCFLNRRFRRTASNNQLVVCVCVYNFYVVSFRWCQCRKKRVSLLFIVVAHQIGNL